MTLKKWFDDGTMDVEAWPILRTRLIHKVAINLPYKDLMQWKVKENSSTKYEETSRCNYIEGACCNYLLIKVVIYYVIVGLCYWNSGL